MTPCESTATHHIHVAGVPTPRRSRLALLCLVLGGLLFICAFVALGVWQVKRLHWKLDLIRRVDSRVHASPIPAPGPKRWGTISAPADEYLHVRLKGEFLPRNAVWVQAVTELGSGFWLVEPLQQADGTLVLVNRGFVPRHGEFGDAAAPANGAQALVTINGLLRMTEPRGAFLRHNDPASGRWYSRDVAAITQTQGLREVAPYFVDQDADAVQSSRFPVPGLTVVKFRNSHLSYAITWFCLAVLTMVGLGIALREERRHVRSH